MSATTTQPTEETQVPIGVRLADLRKKRGMNLRELARLSGASTSLISQVEKGKTNPTVQKLQNLATALGVPVSYFFDPHNGEADLGVVDGPPASSPKKTQSDAPLRAQGSERAHHPTPKLGRGSGVVREGQRMSIDLQDGVHWERLTTGGHPEIEFLEVTYPPGTSSGELAHHYGREFVLVVEGEFDVELAFDHYQLRAGESLAFDSMIPHRVSNHGSVPMRAIWVNWTVPATSAP
jgi:transcriptional regulator with XRE-family HTH domain/quercetin dioxygenase-like cupin family protein